MKISIDLNVIESNFLIVLGMLEKARTSDIEIFIDTIDVNFAHKNYDHIKKIVLNIMELAQKNRELSTKLSNCEDELYHYQDDDGYYSNSKSSLSYIERSAIHLDRLGLVEFTERDPDNLDAIDLDELFEHEIKLTAEGKYILENLKKGRKFKLRPPIRDLNNVFIASAFGHDELDLLYKESFVPACTHFNFKPIRVDLQEPEQTITQYIIDGILDSRFVIADLTHARPSVYFEVGYANSRSIPLLLTCRKDHFKGKKDELKVHFDLEQFKISFWSIDSDGQIHWEDNMSPDIRIQTILNGK